MDDNILPESRHYLVPRGDDLFYSGSFYWIPHISNPNLLVEWGRKYMGDHNIHFWQSTGGYMPVRGEDK